VITAMSRVTQSIHEETEGICGRIAAQTSDGTLKEISRRYGKKNLGKVEILITLKTVRWDMQKKPKRKGGEKAEVGTWREGSWTSPRPSLKLNLARLQCRIDNGGKESLGGLSSAPSRPLKRLRIGIRIWGRTSNSVRKTAFSVCRGEGPNH